MEYRRFGNTVVLRLNKGDEITESIMKTAKEENIRLASVSGIGGTDNFTVGVFDTEKQAYDRFHCTGTHEITSLAGNITTMNGEIYTHLHMNCAGNDGKIVGGHLLECIISLTAEIFIQIADGAADRKRDDSLGINLINFD